MNSSEQMSCFYVVTKMYTVSGASSTYTGIHGKRAHNIYLDMCYSLGVGAILCWTNSPGGW